jgi:uncharacterized RDD family membrane protein YckC
MSLVLMIVSALCFAIAVLSVVASFNTNTLGWIAGGLLAWVLAAIVGAVARRGITPA